MEPEHDQRNWPNEAWDDLKWSEPPGLRNYREAVAASATLPRVHSPTHAKFSRIF